MRHTAEIRQEGATLHMLWDAPTSTAVPIGRPVTVEIADGDEGVYLFRLDERGECIADTWHENVEAAKAQAAFEYGLADEEWVLAD